MLRLRLTKYRERREETETRLGKQRTNVRVTNRESDKTNRN